MEGLRNGEEGAWRQFLERFGGLIHDVPRRLGLDPDERDDVFQTVCVNVFRAIGSLRDPATLSSWVYGIAYRTSVDVWRRKGRLHLQPDFDQQESDGDSSSPEENLAALEDGARVMDAVARLDPRCGRLVRMLYLDDPPVSYTDIGRREKMPVGSIGPTRARCLEKLRRLLSDKDVSNRNRRPTTGRTTLREEEEAT